MKILLFCKNTKANAEALEIAVEQAKAFKGSVSLVGCIAEKPEIPSDVAEEIIKKAEESQQEYIEKIFTPAGIDCTSDVIMTTASFGEEIVQYAENNDIDIIIMGIQKRSKVGKVFFGSSSQYIILEAPCKVLTVQ